MSTEDALPAGLSLGSNGVISGTPTASGAAVEFDVVVTDEDQNSASSTFSIRVESSVTPVITVLVGQTGSSNVDSGNEVRLPIIVDMSTSTLARDGYSVEWALLEAVDEVEAPSSAIPLPDVDDLAPDSVPTETMLAVRGLGRVLLHSGSDELLAELLARYGSTDSFVHDRRGRWSWADPTDKREVGSSNLPRPTDGNGSPS